MVLYQLPNGRTVTITLEQALYMDGTHVSQLVSTGAGEEINNPFHGSVLHGLSYEKRESIEDYEPGVRLGELCVEDQAELSSVAGMDFIFDDGDYLGDFED